MECLKELENLCTKNEDFRRLCALLTLPKLSDHEDLKRWNPSSARMECFYKVLPLTYSLLTGMNANNNKNLSLSNISNADSSSSNDRLIQLFAKGMLYEGAVDYCQKQALVGKNGNFNCYY